MVKSKSANREIRNKKWCSSGHKANDQTKRKESNQKGKLSLLLPRRTRDFAVLQLGICVNRIQSNSIGYFHFSEFGSACTDQCTITINRQLKPSLPSLHRCSGDGNFFAHHQIGIQQVNSGIILLAGCSAAHGTHCAESHNILCMHRTQTKGALYFFFSFFNFYYDGFVLPLLYLWVLFLYLFETVGKNKNAMCY